MIPCTPVLIQDGCGPANCTSHTTRCDTPDTLPVTYMRSFTGSNTAVSASVHGAGSPLVTRKCHVGEPLNVSDHRSLNWHGVFALPPETSMRFRAASKAATCRPRAAGPGTSETDDHASVPVSESVQTSLSGAALE